MRALQLKNSGQELLIEAEPFASGGEGGLYFIKKPFSYRKYVAKLYHPHKRKKEREEKIEYLVARPPSFEKDKEEIVVWPEEVLLENGAFIGFIMPLIKGKKLEVLCSARLPRQLGPAWQHFARDAEGSLDARLEVCYRLAEAVYRVHETNNYVLVDLKPDNVMLKPNGHIALVDMDSVEVVEKGKAVYSAPVATPEYTPPEYYRKEAVPGKTMVPESWDLFSLATIFYKLLLGIHPYAASAKPPLDVLTTLEKKIEAGLFVHANGKQGQFQVVPPPHSAFERLPADLRQLFILCFEVGHELVGIRPTALDWTLALRGEKALALRRSIPSAIYRAPVWDWARPPEAAVSLPKIDWQPKQVALLLPYLSAPRSLWLYRKRVHLLSGLGMGLVATLYFLASDFRAYRYWLLERWPLAIQALILLAALAITVVFALSRTTFYWQYVGYRLRFWQKSTRLKAFRVRERGLRKLYNELEAVKRLTRKKITEDYQALLQDWERLLATYREKLLELDAQVIRLLKEEREAIAAEQAESIPAHPLLKGLPSDSVSVQQNALKQRLQKKTQEIEEQLEQTSIYQRYSGKSLVEKKQAVERQFARKYRELAEIDLRNGKAYDNDLQTQWDKITAERTAVQSSSHTSTAEAFKRALGKRKKRFQGGAIQRFQRLSVAGQRRALKRQLAAEVEDFLNADPQAVLEQRRDNLRRALGALTARKSQGFAPKPAQASQILQRWVATFEQASSLAEVEKQVRNIPEQHFASLRISLRKKVYEAIKDVEAQMSGEKGALGQANDLAELRPDLRYALLQVAPSRLFAHSEDRSAQRLERRLNQLRAAYGQIRASIWRHGKEAQAWHKRFEAWFYPWHQAQQAKSTQEALARLAQEQAACLAAYAEYLKKPSVQGRRLAAEKAALEAAFAERDEALDALAKERQRAQAALKTWQVEQSKREEQVKTPFDERHADLLAQGKKLRSRFEQRFEKLKKEVESLPEQQRKDIAAQLGEAPDKVLAELNKGVAELYALNRQRAALGPKGKPLSFKSYKSTIKNDVGFSIYQ